MQQQVMTTHFAELYLFPFCCMEPFFTDKLSNHFASQPKVKGKPGEKERKKERRKERRKLGFWVHTYLLLFNLASYDSFD
jgi:hypothetical protein